MTAAGDCIAVDGDLPIDLPVHPLADIFPMLDDGDLADLAADIEANGLQIPIMLDAAGEVVVDGRNRLAACKIAGVEPTFDRLRDGEDAAAFIVSANLQRRNLTKGQQAMALAMIYPDAAKGGRGKASRNRDGLEDKTVRNAVSLARAVLRFGREDLAPLVMSGSRLLDDAFAEAKQRQQATMSVEAQLTRLRGSAPDVAALVVEGTLSLAAGLAELDERERTKRNTIESGRRSAERIAISFAADAIAILSAIELGETIVLDDDQRKQIKQTLDLLLREGVIV